MKKIWCCEICETKTMNNNKRCDACNNRSKRMGEEIKRRLHIKYNRGR